MIVRRLDEIAGTDREVRDTNWNSKRLLLRSDGMGFSFHDTTLHPGSETKMWYRNHVEAVYCIQGEGEVVDLDSDTAHPIPRPIPMCITACVTSASARPATDGPSSCVP